MVWHIDNRLPSPPEHTSLDIAREAENGYRHLCVNLLNTDARLDKLWSNLTSRHKTLQNLPFWMRSGQISLDKVSQMCAKPVLNNFLIINQKSSTGTLIFFSCP